MQTSSPNDILVGAKFSQQSIPSIDSPGTSSGGLLPQLSLPPLAPGLVKEIRDAAVFCDDGGYWRTLVGTVDSTAEQFRYLIGAAGHDGLLRLAGCAVIAALPREALEEAIGSLQEIW